MDNEQLKQWRERLGLTQRQMSMYVGVTESVWRSWESGRRGPRGPSLRLLGVLQMVETMAPGVHESLISGARS